MRRIFITMLTFALLASGSGIAVAAQSVVPFEPEPFVATNPCTGQDTELTLVGRLRLRETSTPSGSLHILVHVDATWTTTDGFAGIYKETFTVTDHNPGSFNDFITHTTNHFVGKDGTGRVVRSREQINIRMTPSGPTVKIDRLEAHCSGQR